MHELSIMSNILDIVTESARQNNATKIKKITLKIGVMSDVIPEWAQSYFDMLSKDTIADGAVLDIEKIPVKIRCRACDREFEFKKDEWQFSCPSCASADIELISGRELTVTSIEIE